MLPIEPMAMEDRLSVAVKDLTEKSDNNLFTCTAKPFIFFSVIKK
jgi:hypothetical protein